MINPRSAINFFKTPAGAFLLFCVVLAVIFFVLAQSMVRHRFCEGRRIDHLTIQTPVHVGP